MEGFMQGDINEVIASNVGLVYDQLKKFNLASDPEAESIGFEALYNAVCNFDESKGTKLSTLATVYIYNALGTYVRTLNKKRQLEVISYNNIVGTDEDGDKEYVSLLSNGTNIEDDYIRKEKCKAIQVIVQELYDNLTNEKHKVILAKWRDSCYTATTKDLAKEVGVSQPYVSQVINILKFKLRKRLEEHYYD